MASPGKMFTRDRPESVPLDVIGSSDWVLNPSPPNPFGSAAAFIVAVNVAHRTAYSGHELKGVLSGVVE
jgi:hypothetical protein